MDKNEIELLSTLYGKIVKDLIEKNANYFMFKQTIKWTFNYGKESSIIAAVGKDNLIHINLFSVVNCYLEGDLYTVEYFLLHEIRHIFQNLIIEEYKGGKEVPIETELVKQRIFESNKENYVRALDDNGNEDENYFKQDIEIDAYAFSLAVMKYKYTEEEIKHLYVPTQFKDNFWNIVNDWINYFKKEKL